MRRASLWDLLPPSASRTTIRWSYSPPKRIADSMMTLPSPTKLIAVLSAFICRHARPPILPDGSVVSTVTITASAAIGCAGRMHLAL